MKTILSFCLLLLLLACGKPDAVDSTLPVNSVRSESFEKDSTNVSACTGPTPSNLKIDSVIWHQDLETEGQMVGTLNFHAEAGQLTLQKVCHVGSNTFVASVKSPVIYGQAHLNLVSAGLDETKLSTSTAAYSCKLEMTAGDSINYKFRGPCLELLWHSKTLVFLPPTL